MRRQREDAQGHQGESGPFVVFVLGDIWGEIDGDVLSLESFEPRNDRIQIRKFQILHKLAMAFI